MLCCSVSIADNLNVRESFKVAPLTSGVAPLTSGLEMVLIGP